MLTPGSDFRNAWAGLRPPPPAMAGAASGGDHHDGRQASTGRRVAVATAGGDRPACGRMAGARRRAGAVWGGLSACVRQARQTVI